MNNPARLFRHARRPNPFGGGGNYRIESHKSKEETRKLQVATSRPGEFRWKARRAPDDAAAQLPAPRQRVQGFDGRDDAARETERKGERERRQTLAFLLKLLETLSAFHSRNYNYPPSGWPAAGRAASFKELAGEGTFDWIGRKIIQFVSLFWTKVPHRRATSGPPASAAAAVESENGLSGEPGGCSVGCFTGDVFVVCGAHNVVVVVVGATRWIGC